MLRKLAQRLCGKKPAVAQAAKRKQKVRIALAGRELPAPIKIGKPHVVHGGAATTSRMLSFLTTAGSLVAVGNAATVSFSTEGGLNTYIASSSNLPSLTNALLSSPCNLTMPGSRIGLQHFLFSVCEGTIERVGIAGVAGASNSSASILCLMDYLSRSCLDAVKSDSSILDTIDTIQDIYDTKNFAILTIVLTLAFCMIKAILEMCPRDRLRRDENRRINQRLVDQAAQRQPEMVIIIPPELEEKEEIVINHNELLYQELMARIERIEKCNESKEGKEEKSESAVSKCLLPNVKKILESIIKDLFVDPVNYEVMRDPVTVLSGMNYERSEIKKWLKPGKKCLLTDMDLPMKLPNSNKNMASCIEILLSICEKMISQIENDLKIEKSIVPESEGLRNRR